MALPNLDPEKVLRLVPDASEVEEVGRGGQKLVFRAMVQGQLVALKFALLAGPVADESAEVDSVFMRAKREVDILARCDSPHLVKLGPISLQTAECGGQHLLYFSEAFVEGTTLDAVLRDGPLSIDSTIALGIDISRAVSELWAQQKIHRDIKPSNISLHTGGHFVLLDPGFALDVAAESLSGGIAFGTFAYACPEQFDYSNRRHMDARSDQFSLGVCMYEASTGRHPFSFPGIGASRLFSAIAGQNPVPPSSLNDAVPTALDAIILKMLGKAPHLRFRRMDQLIAALEGIR